MDHKKETWGIELLFLFYYKILFANKVNICYNTLLNKIFIKTKTNMQTVFQSMEVAAAPMVSEWSLMMVFTTIIGSALMISFYAPHILSLMKENTKLQFEV